MYWGLMVNLAIWALFGCVFCAVHLYIWWAMATQVLVKQGKDALTAREAENQVQYSQMVRHIQLSAGIVSTAVVGVIGLAVWVSFSLILPVHSARAEVAFAPSEYSWRRSFWSEVLL
eukprot:GABV01006080.1.p1 GENE.GABV01006080.1~~GABV01006080.1.p1  ORF type:complete len:117 (+),score=4.43 GABV01006080.1:30-380(+)